MYCQTCDDLLASYKFSARVYINALKSLRGLFGEEYRQALQKAEQLRLESEGVSTALLEHWRQHHWDFSKKGAGASS
jgi:hypothetical protein